MTRDLNNKVVLVTGSNGGLGTAVVAAFLSAGARVAGVAPDVRPLDPPNSNFLPVPGAIGSLADARRMIADVETQWGSIHALVHLVGGFAGGKSVADSDDATLDRMLDMNFRAAFHMIRGVLPAMRSRGKGRIIAIGSRTAVEPQAMLGLYSASKAALVSLMGTVARENKDSGITANVILPGTMDTPGNRASMPGANFASWVPPAEIAALLVNLVSDDASSVTGAVIPVYGASL